MADADFRLMTEATGQRIAAALENLVNLGDPVTIAHGGTGATTAAAALSALGGVAISDIVNDLTSTDTDKPLSAAQGKALNDNMASRAKLHRIPFTATTSSHGNASFMNLLDTNKNTVLSVSAHVKASPNTMVVAILYEYSSIQPGRINGIHCISEASNGGVIASTEIEGFIIYVENDTIV